MKKEDYEIDIGVIIGAILRRIWIVIIAIIACAIIAFIYVQYFVTPLYRSTVKIYVNNQSGTTNGYVSTTEISAAKELVNTYIAILKTPDTLGEVRKRADVDYGYSKLLKMIDAESVDETEIFSVSVSAESPDEAKLIAETIADVLPERISKIVEGSSVQIVQEATLPASNYYPSTTKYVLVGGFLGALASILLLVVLELIDNTIKDDGYATDVYGFRTLASIPSVNSNESSYGSSKKKKNKLKIFRRKNKKQVNISHKDERNVLCDKLPFHVSEAYKMLRTSLFNVLEDGPCKTIGVTSSNPRDGKSTMAINLSYVLAQSDKRVLLIDGDLRKPVVAKRLKLSTTDGLAEMLANESENALQPSGYFDNWMVISSGHATGNPSELLSSKEMKQLLAKYRSEFDYIIVDLPPINEVTDAIAVSAYLDGMLLAVKQDVTTRFDLEIAMKHFDFSKTELIGFVYTNASAVSKYGKYSKYSKYARYGYGKYGYSKYGYDKYGYGYGYGYGQNNNNNNNNNN